MTDCISMARATWWFSYDQDYALLLRLTVRGGDRRPDDSGRVSLRGVPTPNCDSSDGEWFSGYQPARFGPMISRRVAAHDGSRAVE